VLLYAAGYVSTYNDITALVASCLVRSEGIAAEIAIHKIQSFLSAPSYYIILGW